MFPVSLSWVGEVAFSQCCQQLARTTVWSLKGISNFFLGEGVEGVSGSFLTTWGVCSSPHRDAFSALRAGCQDVALAPVPATCALTWGPPGASKLPALGGAPEAGVRLPQPGAAWEEERGGARTSLRR